MKYDFKDPEILKILKGLGFTADRIDGNIDQQMPDNSSFVRFVKLMDDNCSTITLEVLKKNISKIDPNAWRPFPKCKPAVSDLFLVTTRNPDDEKEVQFGFWKAEKGEWSIPFRGEVTAFRELPEPYEPEVLK